MKSGDTTKEAILVERAVATIDDIADKSHLDAATKLSLDVGPEIPKPAPLYGEKLKNTLIPLLTSEPPVESGSIRIDVPAVSGGGAAGDAVGPVVVSHS